MGCAGCDECPEDAWHLHLTVRGEHSVQLSREYGYEPAVVQNLFWLDASRTELICTKYAKGPYQEVLTTLVRDACAIASGRVDVLRAKIEGAPGAVPSPLYYETHVKMRSTDVTTWSAAVRTRFPAVSAIGDKRIVTVRALTLKELSAQLDMLELMPGKVEACAFDTAPELDEAWLNQGKGLS